MIQETENPQLAKSVYLCKPVRYAYADLGRYFTQSPQCWFSRSTAQVIIILVVCTLAYLQQIISRAL